jgi:hypothetical protein
LFIFLPAAANASKGDFETVNKGQFDSLSLTIGVGG